MAVTLEQAEKLRERSGASYSDCKEALEQTGGNLLEALLYLERTGRSSTAPRGGYFTTQPGAANPSPAETALVGAAPTGGSRAEGDKRQTDWRRALHTVWETFLNLFRHASANHLEVWRDGKMMTTVPVVIVLILAVVAFWITIPLILVGLFMGCRYHFSGPDLGKEAVNDLMDNVSATVDDMVDQVKREFNKKSKRTEKASKQVQHEMDDLGRCLDHLEDSLSGKKQ